MPPPVAALTLTDPAAPAEADAEVAAAPEPEPEVEEASVATYRTKRGDTLWSIARRHGTTVQTLRSLNGLKSSQLVVGQRISVPTAAGADGS